MPKIKILIFLRYYIPSYRSGGPVRSISSIIESLGEEFSFYVLCVDHDLGSSEHYECIKTNCWQQVGKAKVKYLSSNNLRYFSCLKELKDIQPDLIYLNSVFDLFFSVFPIILGTIYNKIPVLIAPRGELNEGALGLKKIPKLIYLWLLRFSGLKNLVTWHVSSDQEASAVRMLNGWGNVRLYIAGNISIKQLINFDSNFAKKAGEINIVSLARIAPIKNILQAIEMVSKLSGQVNYHIWGVVDDSDYWNQCKEAILKAPPNVKISYCGVADHDEVFSILKRYHIFFLPTLGENFGHSIAEALNSGLPVIISNRTPWKDLEKFGVGADLDLNNLEMFTEVLQKYVLMSEQDFIVSRKACFDYMNQSAEKINLKDEHRKMFLQASGILQ